MRLRATYTITVEYEADTYRGMEKSDIIAHEYSQIADEPSLLESVPGVIRTVEVVEAEK